MTGAATKTKIMLITSTKGSFNELVNMSNASIPSVINTWSRQNSFKLKSLQINDESEDVKASFTVEDRKITVATEDKPAAEIRVTKRFNIQYREVTNLTGG